MPQHTTLSQTPRRLSAILDEARHRAEIESYRGVDWTFMNMLQAERDAFDVWLVKIRHPFAAEAGTQEQRFRRFVGDLVTGRYKGELP